MKIISKMILGLGMLGMACSAQERAQGVEGVIPTVGSWKASQGTLSFKVGSISVAAEKQTELAPLVKMLEGEMVQKGEAGVLHLELGADGNRSMVDGSYQITISDKVTIKSSSASGLYYGTRTLIQMMSLGELPKGVINDAPKYPVRSLLLDVGRKFIPVDGLKDWIRMMGFYKMNELHLHLNDNSWGRYPGYRLESKKFPGLASKDGHYTFKQIRELQDFAKLHGVVIVPEIDSPGHSLAFTTYRPELAHPEINRGGFGLAYLDLRNPDAIKFMEDIWDEVCPLFDSELVHIGTDEYRLNLIKNKEDRDALGESFRQYINHLNKYIREKHGKTVRTWSGYEHMPGTTEPDTTVIIDMWETADAKNKVKAGYKVVNSSHFYTYIVPGAPYYGVNNKFIYDTWTPKQFSGKPEGMLDDSDPGLMGGKLHVWNDFGPSGYTWNEIARLTAPSMAVMSEKLWASKKGADFKPISYEANMKNAKSYEAIMPKVNLFKRDAIKDVVGSKVWSLEKERIFIANSKVELGLKSENLEWPWTAKFSLTRHHDVAGDEILVSSKLAAFYVDLEREITDKKTKKVTKKRGFACVRANQAYGFDPLTSYNPDVLLFDYQVPVGEKVEITLVGERRKTSLYVNGKLIQSIGKQMVCPLTRLGDVLPRGMHGTLHSASISAKAPRNLKVGGWKSGELSEEFKTVEFDLNEAIKAAGSLSVEFDYQSGLHKLLVKNAELLEDGVVISKDEHDGVTGGQDSDNIYTLKLKKYKKGAKYQLRAKVKTGGGSDSNGVIRVR